MQDVHQAVLTDELLNTTTPDSDDYLVTVPSVPVLMVSKSGLCYNKLAQKLIAPYLGNKNVAYMRVRVGPYTGTYALRRLVAEVFVKTYPVGRTIEDINDLFIVHRDNDPTNVESKNLVWADHNTNNYLEILNSGRYGDDFLHVIPSVPLYAVSRAGELRNLVYGFQLSRNKNKLGYIRARFTKTDTNKTNLLHRLIGEVFVPPKEGYTIEECVRDLDINHKNLDKSDCSPSNLEWVTKTENTVHLYENGARSDIDRLLVRHIETNEVALWRSLQHFAESNKFPRKLLSRIRDLGLLDKVIVGNFTLCHLQDNKQPVTKDALLRLLVKPLDLRRNDGFRLVTSFRYFARILPFTAQGMLPLTDSTEVKKVGKWSKTKYTA